MSIRKRIEELKQGQRKVTPEVLAEFKEAAAKFLKDLAADKCPTCGQPIEPSTKIGRCLYGACGHRIGQV
jgi:hypothetical protein